MVSCRCIGLTLNSVDVKVLLTIVFDLKETNTIALWLKYCFSVLDWLMCKWRMGVKVIHQKHTLLWVFWNGEAPHLTHCWWLVCQYMRKGVLLSQNDISNTSRINTISQHLRGLMQSILAARQLQWFLLKLLMFNCGCCSYQIMLTELCFMICFHYTSLRWKLHPTAPNHIHYLCLQLAGN